MMKKVILDTNMLLLFTIGSINLEFLSHKRVSAFGVEGYKRVSAAVGKFDKIIVTPHLLTEAWNFTGNDATKDRMQLAIKAGFRGLIEQAIEIYTPASRIFSEPYFSHLGVADTAQIVAAKENACPIFTVDGYLISFAAAMSVEAINPLYPY